MTIVLRVPPQTQLYTNASTRTSDTYAIAIKGFPDAVVYFSSITPLTGITLELSNRGDVY